MMTDEAENGYHYSFIRCCIQKVMEKGYIAPFVLQLCIKYSNTMIKQQLQGVKHPCRNRNNKDGFGNLCLFDVPCFYASFLQSH